MSDFTAFVVLLILPILFLYTGKYFAGRITSWVDAQAPRWRAQYTARRAARKAQLEDIKRRYSQESEAGHE